MWLSWLCPNDHWLNNLKQDFLQSRVSEVSRLNLNDCWVSVWNNPRHVHPCVQVNAFWCTFLRKNAVTGCYRYEIWQVHIKSMNCVDQPLPTCWSSHVRVITSISRCCHGCLPLRVFEETASKRPESSWENHDAANVWCLGAFPHYFFARWHEIALGSTIVHLIHRKHCWLLIFDRYAVCVIQFQQQLLLHELSKWNS